MAAPVSLRLLPHTAEARTVTGFDEDRKPVYGERITLKHVRCTAFRQNSYTSLGVQSADKMTLIFDCVNSEPAGFVPLKNMTITSGGQDYTVRDVTPCCDGSSTVHHYEVALV